MPDDISKYFDLEAAVEEDEDASDCEYETDDFGTLLIKSGSRT